MKKALAIILTLALCALFIAGCATPNAPGGGSPSPGSAPVLKGKDVTTDKIQIAWIPMSTAGQVNKIVQQAADEVSAAYPNVSVQFFDAQFNPQTQITQINECVTQGYNAILMECADSTAVGPAITAAEKAGVAVITVNLNTDVPHSLYVKMDSYSGGQVSAEALVKMLGGKGNYLVLDVPAVQAASTTFGKGFMDYCDKYPDMKRLEYFNLAGNAQEDAYNTMRDMLTKYDDIQAVYAPDDNYGLGIIQAINEAGRQGDGILVWGTDLQPGGIEAIQSGALAGSCWSDRYSSMVGAFSYAIALAQTGATAGALGLTSTPSIFVRFIAVTQDNINQVLPLTRWPGYNS